MLSKKSLKKKTRNLKSLNERKVFLEFSKNIFCRISENIKLISKSFKQIHVTFLVLTYAVFYIVYTTSIEMLEAWNIT